MTREEAKDYIREWCPHDRQEEIIKALEQEPCENEDVISRQATLDAIIKRLGIKNETCLLEAERAIYQQILAMPPVTPQPRTGYWVSIDEEPHEVYECDRCGRVASTFTANIEPHIEYKYCPNCGAKMVEPQESEEEE